MELPDERWHPSLRSIVDAMLAVWPEHAAFLGRSLPAGDADALAHAERVAATLDRLIGDRRAEVCGDYRWTCERLLEEELHFRRHGAYRLSRFADAEREVYANPAFMARYVNGLLLSHLFWANHRGVLRSFETSFLPRCPEAFRYLEIGPGHGLYLALAAGRPGCREAVGWDVSETSAEQTRLSLARLGAGGRARIERADILYPPGEAGGFDAVVVSEVLEHLEDPDAVLASLRALAAPDGLLFVNMPVNSPAPDHIYLLREPDEVRQLVERNGFALVETANFPATGYSEERARKHGATISCVVIATPAS